MRDTLAVSAAVISVFSTLPYILDIVKSKTKPNIVSWFTWTLLTAIATSATFAAHEPRTALLTLGGTVATAAVVVFGLKYGVAKFGKFDILCQVFAVLGLVFWLIFNSPTIGIIVPLGVDFIALLPTLKHAWQKPFEETWLTFTIGTAAAILTICSLSTYSLNSLVYPLYLAVANAVIVAVIFFGRRINRGIRVL